MKVDAATTLGFSAYGIETALQQISELGFDKVELSQMGTFCVHLPYPETESQLVKEALEYPTIDVMENLTNRNANILSQFDNLPDNISTSDNSPGSGCCYNDE